MRYAEGTTVPAERSQDEIRRILMKHGATHYVIGEAPERVVIQFKVDERQYRFDVVRPTSPELRERFIAEQGDSWSASSRANRIDWAGRVAQEWRRRWRARLLWLKAQLEFAEEVPLQESLMAAMVLPDGRTFAGWATPQIEAMYETGRMPPLLGDGT